MINAEHLPQALRLLQRLIVHAKARAYDAGDPRVAELLNDFELLPEFIADDHDRTADFFELIESLSAAHPECGYVFEDVPSEATSSP